MSPSCRHLRPRAAAPGRPLRPVEKGSASEVSVYGTRVSGSGGSPGSPLDRHRVRPRFGRELPGGVDVPGLDLLGRVEETSVPAAR